MKKEKTKIITLSISALVILVSIIGYTYSYFSANVREVNKTETLVKTNELNITYTGGQEINAGNMIPGDSFTKTFSVENTSNKAVTFNIYMENITNEFNEDLIYFLNDENEELIIRKVLPQTSKEKSYLKTNLKIEANTIKNYTLKLELLNFLNIDQSENQGSIFSATVGIDTAQNITDYKGILATTYQDNKEAFYGQRENITKVVLENTLQPKENATYSYDVSEGQDKSVMSYLVENTENPSTYTLYLQGEGKIKANGDSKYLFYNFINLTEIENLEYLDTSNVTNMRYMFFGCGNLTSIDLRFFNTENVIDMNSMFGKCESLLTIEGLENFNTSRVIHMGGMFIHCKSLTSVNELKNFDTSNVESASGMFYSCMNLVELDLTSFDMKNLFSRDMFKNMPSNAIIKVKDETVQTRVLNTEGRPSSWTVDNVIIAS